MLPIARYFYTTLSCDLNIWSPRLCVSFDMLICSLLAPTCRNLSAIRRDQINLLKDWN